MNEFVLMAHAFFGLTCLLTAIWIFVETLHADTGNALRIRRVSWIGAGVMWIAFIAGGYWYTTFYKADKAIILSGPWKFSHNFFMETKEHLVILLLLLVTYLPIAASNDLAASKEARRLVLWVAAIAALLALAMDGDGALIAMGVKKGLLAK